MARRKGNGQPRAITAAARHVDLSKKYKIPPRPEWQKEAWSYFDEVPEVKELILWRANQIAKVKLFVAVTPEGEGSDVEPVNVLDDTAGIDPSIARLVTDELEGVRAVVGGQAEILRRLEINLEVPGECWLIYVAERTPADDEDEGRAAEWLVASMDELVSETNSEGTTYYVKRDPDDKKPQWLKLDNGSDDLFRIWQPHGRWFERADSSMRGVLGDCELLMILQGQLKAESRSRASAGVFAIPNELSVVPIRRESEQRPDDEGDPLINELITALTEPTADPNHEATIVPLLLRGPGDFMTPDKLRHFLISRESTEALDRRIEARVLRVARGMNGPVEVVMGLQQTTFANAKQVDEDTFEDYLEPRVIFDCDALTIGAMRPRWLRLGVDPEIVDRMFVWYDPSDLLASPDTEANANDAFDRFVISDDTYRRVKGFGEDDVPEPLEVINRIASRRGIFTADLTAAMLEALADEAGVELPDAPESLDPGSTAPAENGEAARRRELASLLAQAMIANRAQSNGHTPLAARSTPISNDGRTLGRKLADIDADLRTRLLVAANDAMERALERAGNRLKAKRGEIRDTLRRVPPHLCAATLGPALVAQAGLSDEDLLAGSWDALERQFKAWGAQSQKQALNLVYKAVGGFTASERDRLGLRMAEDLDEAWEWMSESLTSLAAAKLYDPLLPVDALGEFDPTLKVPPGLVRQAVTRAGGAAGIETHQPRVGDKPGQGGAWVSLAQGGTRPAGGIATGEIVHDALRDHGGGVEAYLWDYGQAFRARPFEPHVQLDGVEFENFDDPILSNYADGWTGFAFYMPGDHAGCMCDAVPIIRTVETYERVVPEYVPADVEPTSTMRSLLDRAKDVEGFTVQPISGNVPSTGFMVSRPNTSKIVPADEFFESPERAREIVVEYLKEHRGVFDDQTTFLGGWWDKEHGEFVVDISDRVGSKSYAVQRGIERDQQAIFDIASGDVIKTGGSGQR